MGVEPTSRVAKERDNGFEDREGHRPLCASAWPRDEEIGSTERTCCAL